MSGVLEGLRGLLLRFILPLAGLGLVLWAGEAAAEALGYHQDVVKMLRVAIIPLYLVVMLLGARKRS